MHMPDNGKMIKVNLTFRHMDASDPLKDYATEKLTNCLQKFVHRDTEVHAVLKVEKNFQIAEVNFRADGADFACKESSADMYASIDALIATLTQQLRKNKEKLTDHH
jgi:putative sigma-54 modulation protein